MGREELAVVGAGLLSLEKLAVVGAGLCRTWGDPYEVASSLVKLHRVTVLAYEHQYRGRHGEVAAAGYLEVMCAIGKLLGVHDEPIPTPGIADHFSWKHYDAQAIHDRAWRLLRNPELVKQARLSAWSLVYNALDNNGNDYMTDNDRREALAMCQALLVLD
jgi:hypothetical protein